MRKKIGPVTSNGRGLREVKVHLAALPRQVRKWSCARTHEHEIVLPGPTVFDLSIKSEVRKFDLPPCIPYLSSKLLGLVFRHIAKSKQSNTDRACIINGRCRESLDQRSHPMPPSCQISASNFSTARPFRQKSAAASLQANHYSRPVQGTVPFADGVHHSTSLGSFARSCPVSRL